MIAETLVAKRILVVEDDYIQSQDIAQTLISKGADVLVFDEVRGALGFLGNNSVDIALLDVQLGKELSYPIADELFRTSTPFILLSGHKQADVPPRFARVPFVGKPCSHDEVVALLISTAYGNGMILQVFEGLAAAAIGFNCESGVVNVRQLPPLWRKRTGTQTLYKPVRNPCACRRQHAHALVVLVLRLASVVGLFVKWEPLVLSSGDSARRTTLRG